MKVTAGVSGFKSLETHKSSNAFNSAVRSSSESCFLTLQRIEIAPVLSGLVLGN
jgi:hypothetical protein